MEFSFRVDHDAANCNAVVKYQMQILPMFIEFDGHNELIIPVHDLSEEAIVAWIDDRLVEFTRIYFKVYFNDEYQKNSLETDPVMHVRFPRAFAATTTVHQKCTYHFYTKESYHLFERDPDAYVAAPS